EPRGKKKGGAVGRETARRRCGLVDGARTCRGHRAKPAVAAHKAHSAVLARSLRVRFGWLGKGRAERRDRSGGREGAAWTCGRRTILSRASCEASSRRPQGPQRSARAIAAACRRARDEMAARAPVDC